MLKIAATTNGPSPEDNISDLFGSCTHILIFDGETDKLVEVIERGNKIRKSYIKRTFGKIDERR